MNGFWKNRKVLITGADGFIGSHLTERLLALGASVRAMTSYNSFNSWGWIDTFSPEQKAALEVVCSDVRDPFGADRAVEGMQTVFHLAALIAIPYSYTAPAAYVETNVKGTLNMLEAARRHKVERFVHTSTSEVYGTALRVPISEDHPLQPQSPYSASKMGADSLAMSYHLSFGLPLVTVRPFNTYGPRQSARAVIPAIIVQLLSGAQELRLGSLSPTRDYTYAKDTAEGFVLAAMSDAAVGRTVNLGSGREISIGELAEKLKGLCGSNARIVEDARRVRPENSEVRRLLCDNSLALELFGWSAKTGLHEGLEKTVAWLRQNLEAYKADIYNV